MYHTEYLSLDMLTYSEEDRYKFLMGTVIPRPIALVTSLNEDGVLNAAPFSQFVVISVSPPLLAFVAKERTDGLKDTVRNVLASGEFVINTVTERMAEQVQQCSNDYPPPVSEVELVGFHPIPSSIVRPSRIAESPHSSNAACTAPWNLASLDHSRICASARSCLSIAPRVSCPVTGSSTR